MTFIPTLIKNIFSKPPTSQNSPIKEHISPAITVKSVPKSIQVCLLGGHTMLGKMTCLLLKQNPLISAIKFQGEEDVYYAARDINSIDTKCRIECFPSYTEIPKALRGADIILILKDNDLPENTKLTDRVMSEAKRVCDIAKECTLHAPRSIIIVAVPPVSVFTPLVSEVFKQSNFYRPQRIIGSAAMAQIKLNTMVGRYQGLNPFICQVPIVGGPDLDLAVPLFSRAKPVELDYTMAECLTGRFRQVKANEFPKKHCRSNFIENHDLSEAFALNNLIATICYGLLGDKKAFTNAFIRTNLIPTCKHLVTTLRFGESGVSYNCGLPHLTNFELDMFERAIMEISKREKIAAEIVEYMKGIHKIPPFIKREQNTEKMLKNQIIRL